MFSFIFCCTYITVKFYKNFFDNDRFNKNTYYYTPIYKNHRFVNDFLSTVISIVIHMLPKIYIYPGYHWFTTINHIIKTYKLY